MADTQKSGWGIQEKLIAVLVVALLVASGGLGYLYGQLTALGGKVANTAAKITGETDAAANPTPEPPVVLSDDQWQELIKNPTAVKGGDDAKVVMVEFTDYQCPFCARHVTQTDSKIQEEYVKTNKVRYIMRDLPLPFHSNANLAAQAARCAGDQNKYWEMHDKLFASQEEWSEGDGKTKFVSYATNLGLNKTNFEQCLTSEKYKSAVQADLDLAQKVGANGTPTFFINGKMLVGAQPFDAFKTIIDEALQ